MDFRYEDQGSDLSDSTCTALDLEISQGGPDFSAKRLFDIAAASLGLLFLAPLLICVGLLIRLQDGHKALYSQTRIGLNGEVFQCFKLRSMVPNAAEKLQALLDNNPDAKREWELTQKLSNDPRITPIGKFIRATSIDELPQLLNIIRGDMSVVGPRPIQFYERARYGDVLPLYYSVRPGLTGLWQTSGRSNTTYSERIALDKKYVQTRTFWGDVWIILKTVPVVLMSVGAK